MQASPSTACSQCLQRRQSSRGVPRWWKGACAGSTSKAHRRHSEGRQNGCRYSPGQQQLLLAMPMHVLSPATVRHKHVCIVLSNPSQPHRSGCCCAALARQAGRTRCCWPTRPAVARSAGCCSSRCNRDKWEASHTDNRQQVRKRGCVQLCVPGVKWAAAQFCQPEGQQGFRQLGGRCTCSGRKHIQCKAGHISTENSQDAGEREGCIPGTPRLGQGPRQLVVVHVAAGRGMHARTTILLRPVQTGVRLCRICAALVTVRHSSRRQLDTQPCPLTAARARGTSRLIPTQRGEDLHVSMARHAVPSTGLISKHAHPLLHRGCAQRPLNLRPALTLAQASPPLRLFWLFRCSSVSWGKLPFWPQLAGRVPAPRRNVQGNQIWCQAVLSVQGQR